jgi:quinoprotein relay system zinc metallohydrolase 2
LPPDAERAACVARASDAAAALHEGVAAQAWPCVPAGATPDFTVTEVVPGLFVHRGAVALADATNGGDIANLAFVVGRDSVAVIDAGSTPALARKVLAAVRARTALPVRWLILTHAHPDHTLGATVFREAGATIVGHARLERALAIRAEAYAAAARASTGAQIDPAKIASPDIAVESLREIDLGDRVLRLEAHPPAHSGADLTIRDLATDTLLLGDLLFVDHVPVVDASLVGWIALLDDLAERPAARAVPGHGPVAVSWPEGAAPMRDYLAWLARTARAAIAEGAPTLEAVRRIAAQTPGDWALTGDFAERNAMAAIRELEWE